MNLVQDTVDIAQYIMIPETQDSIPSLFNLLRTGDIPRVFRVLTAIQFDYKLRSATGKIHDERPDHRLTPEMRSVQ